MKPPTSAPPPPEDLTLGPQASLPGIAGWSDDADLARGPRAVFSTNPPGVAAGELPSIGRIARYDLKYRIGEGGLATVYAAHDPVLSRLVAIKTVHVAVPPAERENFDALFMHEARAAAALSHPNIVTVFDAGLADSGAYIAMELLKGVDLRRLLDEGWRPTPAQAAQLAAKVADALAYAHAHGVIHRDIKPANIFMVGRSQPRVLDFGIARLTHQIDAGDDAEVCGGSPYYMAPEQILQQPTDARCDVFSLGVVLYELLAGARPFEGSELAQIQRAVLEHVPPPADTIAPGVPAALARIAARAMAKYPDGRYPSAGAMARALRAYQDERAGGAASTASTPAAPSAPAPRGARRVPWLLGAALLLALIATWFVWSQRQAAVQTVTTRGAARIDVDTGHRAPAAIALAAHSRTAMSRRALTRLRTQGTRSARA